LNSAISPEFTAVAFFNTPDIRPKVADHGVCASSRFNLAGCK
jgi:hypothetical protein